MSTIIVFRLPTGGSGCDDVSFTTKGIDFHVKIKYSDHTSQKTYGLSFESFTAFRFCDEMHAHNFLSDSYDAVCEIKNSRWVTELTAFHSPAKRYLHARHFAVLLSNFGYLEIVSEDAHQFPSDEEISVEAGPTN